MPRVMQRGHAVLVPGAFQTVATVPAGHKYEILAMWLGNDGIATPRWLVLGAGNWVSDRTLGAGRVVDPVQLGPVVLFAGETLVVVEISGPAAAQAVDWTYIDVLL